MAPVPSAGRSEEKSGNTDNVHGIALYGAINCRAGNLRFENLGFGMKPASGPIASGWVIEDIVVKNCLTPIYASHMVDSNFINLSLEGSGAGGDKDHCIYLAQEMLRVTLKNITLTKPSGYARTSAPRVANRSARWLPMNPSAPVTSTLRPAQFIPNPIDSPKSPSPAPSFTRL